MKIYAFPCGGVHLSDAGSASQTIPLDVAGPERNVNLRLYDAYRALLSHLPDLLVDLLEIAAYVYCADQRASRGSETLVRAGEHWRRHLHFIVPVRCPEIWSSEAVRQQLEATLGFLSDDVYTFEFVSSDAGLAKGQTYFSDLAEGQGFIPDDVILFSGGVDSLAGAVESLSEGKRVVLVGHHSASKVVATQKELVADLRQAGFASQIFHVTVNVTNTGATPVEPTQRTRSFLFASLAFVLARMFGRDGFAFYENGVVSLNLPIAGDVLGARATRTTHPKVMRDFETLFSQLIGQRIDIATPYLWRTKKEIVEQLVSRGHGSLLARSVSCVHPIQWTRDVRHCGRCSQCIDRRFAVLAAGAEQYDPDEGYGIDLLIGDRRHADLDPAIAYVRFARRVAGMPRHQFQWEFPQVSAALHAVPGLTANEALDRVCELHQRHGGDVLSVLSEATRRHSDDLVQGTLSPASLLNLCFVRGRLENVDGDVTAQTAKFIDRLSAAQCEFAVDATANRICFKGGYEVVGAGYRVVHALLDRYRTAKQQNLEVPFYWTAHLAAELRVEEATLRQQIGRLREDVEARLAVDHGVVLPDGFIENQRLQGYRLSPHLREVSLADL
jgi:7-cyano-7-deazaguanine synthase in queuosine biosynthesis